MTASITILWIVAGIGVAAILVTWMARRQQRGSASDLGFVTERWLAEHRLSETAGH